MVAFFSQLFERENLMLMAIRMSGCGAEVEPMTRLIHQWRRVGLLIKDEARQLADLAPMSRSGGWWVEESESVVETGVL